MDDPAYISAIAALAGSTIGGLTSLAASWLSHRIQFLAQYRGRTSRSRSDLSTK